MFNFLLRSTLKFIPAESVSPLLERYTHKLFALLLCVCELKKLALDGGCQGE